MVTCICSTGITPLSTPITTRGKFVAGNTEIGTLKGKINAGRGENRRKEKIVRVEPRQPEGLLAGLRGWKQGRTLRWHQSPPRLAGGGRLVVIRRRAHFTLVPSSSPYPPTVITDPTATGRLLFAPLRRPRCPESPAWGAPRRPRPPPSPICCRPARSESRSRNLPACATVLPVIETFTGVPT